MAVTIVKNKALERAYAVIDKDGYFQTGTDLYSTERHILLRTKADALRYIEIYYRNKGYKVKRMKAR